MSVRLIDTSDQRRLLALARQVFDARVRRQPLPVPETDVAAASDRTLGAFVTIRRLGELRGCLGRLHTPEPMVVVIVELAASVADSDPRFDPVLPHELGQIELEISVLGAERLVASIEEIEPGRHGLIVEDGSCQGLLLPQVAAEQGWDRETFLAFTCRKALLPADAWRRGARIFTFEAQVFRELSSSSQEVPTSQGLCR